MGVARFPNKVILAAPHFRWRPPFLGPHNIGNPPPTLPSFRVIRDQHDFDCQPTIRPSPNFCPFPCLLQHNITCFSISPQLNGSVLGDPPTIPALYGHRSHASDWYRRFTARSARIFSESRLGRFFFSQAGLYH